MQWSTVTSAPLHIILFCWTTLYTHSGLFHTVLHMFTFNTPPYVYILCSIHTTPFCTYSCAYIRLNYFFDTYFSLEPTTILFNTEGLYMYELLWSTFIRHRWLRSCWKRFTYPYSCTEPMPNFTQGSFMGRANFKFN